MPGPAIEPKLLGELAVVIIKAKNLPDRSKIGKHNPYVVVQYRQEKRKSKVVKKGGQHPEFDDEVRFKIYEETEDILNRPSKSSDTPSMVTDASSSSNPNSNGQGGMARLPLNKSIQVQVWADDSKEPKIVGECSVDLSEVFRTCEQDDSYELQYKNRYAGEISLELTYFINDAPPIPKKVAKPVIPPKPTHSNSITSISTIATFDGPAGFPLKGSGGSTRRPVQPTGHAYHASIEDRRYLQHYQADPVNSGMGMGADEWGARAGSASHRQSFSGRPTSVVPGYDSYGSHQASMDSLGGSLSSMSIGSQSHGSNMPFPSATHLPPHIPPPPTLPPQPYPSMPDHAAAMSTPPPPLGQPQTHSHGHRYSMSGAIPQSSSWNGNPAVTGGNYQPAPSSSYGTLPPLPPPPSMQIPPRLSTPQAYSNHIPPSSSFPQLYQADPSAPAGGYQSSYGGHTPAPPAPSSIPQSSRTPVPGDYTGGPPPILWHAQSAPPQSMPSSSSNAYQHQQQQRPASTNPGAYIPPPLIDNRPPPRPSSQPMVQPQSATYASANQNQNQTYGQLPPPPPAGHYPLPTSSFHYSSTTPAPGSAPYGDAQARPLPLPTPASGGYQDAGYAPNHNQPVQGDWRDASYNTPVADTTGAGYQGTNQNQGYGYQQGGPNNTYAQTSMPPPVPPSSVPPQTSYGYDHQVGQNQHQWDQGQGQHQGYPPQPPAPPPRPHSPPNALTEGFAARNTPQTQGAGRSFLANLGVDEQQQQPLPPGGGYGLPPRLPDSLTGGGNYGGY